MEPSWLAPNWAGVHHPLLASFTLSHSPQGAWLRHDNPVPNGDTKQPHSQVADGLKEPKPQKLSKDNLSSLGCLWLVLALTSGGCECGPNHHYHILQQREHRESKAIPRKLAGHVAEPEHDKSIQHRYNNRLHSPLLNNEADSELKGLSGENEAYYTHILKFYIWLTTTELCSLQQIQHNKCKSVPTSRENNGFPKLLACRTRQIQCLNTKTRARVSYMKERITMYGNVAARSTGETWCSPIKPNLRCIVASPCVPKSKSSFTVAGGQVFRCSGCRLGKKKTRGKDMTRSTARSTSEGALSCLLS